MRYIKLNNITFYSSSLPSQSNTPPSIYNHFIGLFYIQEAKSINITNLWVNDVNITSGAGIPTIYFDNSESFVYVKELNFINTSPLISIIIRKLENFIKTFISLGLMNHISKT